MRSLRHVVAALAGSLALLLLTVGQALADGSGGPFPK
jgi:hypothetical protein